MCADPPQRTWEPDNRTRRPTGKPAISPKTGPRPVKAPPSHVQHRRRPEKTDTIPGRGGHRELLSRTAAVRIRRAAPMSSIPPRRAADESRRRTLSAPDAPATDPPSTGRVSDTEDKYCLRSTDTPHPRRDRSGSASRSVEFRAEIGPVPRRDRSSVPRRGPPSFGRSLLGRGWPFEGSVRASTGFQGALPGQRGPPARSYPVGSYLPARSRASGLVVVR